MALVSKETIVKGVGEVLLMTVSGVLCIAASRVVVARALAPIGAAPIPAAAAPGPAHGGGQGAERGGGHGEAAPAHGAETGVAYPLKTTVVNLASDSDHRFAKVSITLEGHDAATVDRLKEMDHQVYDSLIEILGNVRAQDVATDEGKERLKDSIRERLNRLLPDSAGVKSVYLTEFLVQ
ncbi:MAG: flagellar basal body-associated FliL family protein [Elusimicrobia bacterium]|nr:flagellar basal body-associated FliL family protein [Elusimicrobiota bacterium]